MEPAGNAGFFLSSCRLSQDKKPCSCDRLCFQEHEAIARGKHLRELEGGSYCATLRQGKVLLAFREHLNTNMVSAGRAVLFNAAEHGFQVSPGNHGIDQSIAASLSKIGFAKT